MHFFGVVGFGFLDFCLLGSGHRVGAQQYAYKVYLFICMYFWLLWVFIAVRGLFL